MEKSLDEAAAERRDYVEQVRASFYEPSAGRSMGGAYRYGAGQESEFPPLAFGFGARLVVAILLFAAFVYCDQNSITFQTYGTADIVQQIEWDPLPVGQFMEMALQSADAY